MENLTWCILSFIDYNNENRYLAIFKANMGNYFKLFLSKLSKSCYKCLTLPSIFTFKIKVKMNAWLLLAGAIILEIIATSLLNKSDGFKQLVPTVGALLLYAGSFYLLSLVLRTLPVGIAYAVWSGVGIVLTSIVAYFAFGQKIDAYGILGIGLIIAGVVVLNVFSNTGH